MISLSVNYVAEILAMTFTICVLCYAPTLKITTQVNSRLHRAHAQMLTIIIGTCRYTLRFAVH
ncbi:unnamed protein product [Spodoptera exigua]|nr:unnamed protein product [Spodoptera exigua]